MRSISLSFLPQMLFRFGTIDKRSDSQAADGLMAAAVFEAGWQVRRTEGLRQVFLFSGAQAWYCTKASY